MPHVITPRRDNMLTSHRFNDTCESRCKRVLAMRLTNSERSNRCIRSSETTTLRYLRRIVSIFDSSSFLSISPFYSRVLRAPSYLSSAHRAVGEKESSCHQFSYTFCSRRVENPKISGGVERLIKVSPR